MHCDHPPLPEFPRATKQQAVALLTASAVNPGGVSFCSRLRSFLLLSVLCLLQGSSFSFRPFPHQHTLSSRPWPREVSCPLQRVHAAQTAASILAALAESLLDGYRAHLAVLHSSVGLSEGKGTVSQQGSVIFRGADESRGDRPQQPVAAKIREGTQPMGCAPAVCAELLGRCTGSDHRGEHGQHGHMYLPAKSRLPACLQPRENLGIW